ncbi:MAG: hypothetical protein V5A39_03855 [Haloarculaceae archaeon]
MLELAADHLSSPISVTVDTWEDGTYRIQAYHCRPDEREVLYYHSDEGVVRYGVEAGDDLKCDREVTRIEPPEGSTESTRDASDGGGLPSEGERS